VEALEDYEGGDVDGYSDVSAENSLLSGGRKRRVSMQLLFIYLMGHLNRTGPTDAIPPFSILFSIWVVLAFPFGGCNAMQQCDPTTLKPSQLGCTYTIISLPLWPSSCRALIAG